MQMKKAQVIIENEDKELTFGLIVKNPWNVFVENCNPWLVLAGQGLRPCRDCF